MSELFNPLIERNDYGICDQVERGLLQLDDKGMLPKDMYEQNKDRIEKCRKRMNIRHMARQIIASTLKTFQQIQEENPQHCLKLVCDCGNVVTCRCSTPKTEVRGICQKCSEGVE